MMQRLYAWLLGSVEHAGNLKLVDINILATGW